MRSRQVQFSLCENVLEPFELTSSRNLAVQDFELPHPHIQYNTSSEAFDSLDRRPYSIQSDKVNCVSASIGTG